MNTRPILLLAGALALAANIHAQTISGTVSTPSGIPFAGVTVTATRAFPFERVTDVTDSAGRYTLGSILNGLDGTYAVVASLSGFVFVPASTNVTVDNPRGEVVDFTTTADAPHVSTLAALNVTVTSATLPASVDANGAVTTLFFRYGVSPTLESVSTSVNAGSSQNAVTVNIPVTGLLAGTEYFYRAEVSNRFGSYVGVARSFVTFPTGPLILTTTPTNGGATSMTLNGRVHPNGSNTMVWFEVGTTTNYGNPAVVQNVGSGASFINLSQTLVGLIPGTTYHFRAVAAWNGVTNRGADRLFTPGFGYTGYSGMSAPYSGLAWGDYDNDGRLDILAAGAVWRNTGGGFTNINAGLPSATDGAVAWGDSNNDGRQDVFRSGWNYANFNTALARVFHNNGNGTFSDSGAGLPVIARSSVAWGDYDNDGRPDLLLSGLNSNINPVTQVWRNTGAGYVQDANAVLPGVAYGAVAWSDYDNDGRLDILLAGATNSGQVNLSDNRTIAQVWRNTGQGFVNINAGLPGVSGGNNRSAVAWGDYDNDGWLDLALAGSASNDYSGLIAQVWRNTGDGFALDTNAPLTPVTDSSLAWGDYDHDGRLDLLLTGRRVDSGLVTEVWRNTGSGFVDIGAGLPGTFDGAAAWGDYDNDGRLDLVIGGLGHPGQVWRNNFPITNSPPSAPSELALNVSNTVAVLTWSAASDDATPAIGLTYNLRIGTTPGGSDVLAPAAAANGWRRVPEMGNAQGSLSALFRFDLATTYYWSVQAVDGGFAGSPFALEQSFKFLPISVPPASTSIIPGDLNGDGIVDESELNGVLSHYFPTSPWLEMTNVAGLGGTNVTFALTNDLAGAFSVEYTTNLLDWLFLGPATPRYEFTDINAPVEPQRYYRLRWP